MLGPYSVEARVVERPCTEAAQTGRVVRPVAARLVLGWPVVMSVVAPSRLTKPEIMRRTPEAESVAVA